MPCLPLSHPNLCIAFFSHTLLFHPYLTTDHRELCCMMYSGKDTYQLAFRDKTQAHTNTYSSCTSNPATQCPICPAVLCPLAPLLLPLLPPLLGEDGRETALKLG